MFNVKNFIKEKEEREKQVFNYNLIRTAIELYTKAIASRSIFECDDLYYIKNEAIRSLAEELIKIAELKDKLESYDVEEVDDFFEVYIEEAYRKLTLNK